MGINVEVNGEQKEFKEGITLKKMLQILEVDTDVAVVRLNEKKVDKEKLEDIEIKNNDNLEYIYYMGGGAFDFTEEEVERYSRHIILEELGGTGQEKIKNAKVLIVGAGGLGSPLAYYLAAAGVGHLGIVDNDVVDRSNLQRQILHYTDDIDGSKVESARQKLKKINPNINITSYQQYLNKDNIVDIIKDYEIIVDGVDNFPARYLINDACVMHNKILVDAGILRFEGQVMTIEPGTGPCFRCVFREPPPEDAVPNCQEAGVLGVIAGTIGTIQATEVIKLITDTGKPLIGELLVYDAKDYSFRKVNIKRDKNCPVCGDDPEITELMEYEISCDIH